MIDEDRCFRYFVVSMGEGDPRVYCLTKKELDRWLQDHIDDDVTSEYRVKFKSSIENCDMNYWGDKEHLIVKGRIVTPTPVQTVTEYEID